MGSQEKNNSKFKIVNLTPHIIKISNLENLDIIEVEPSGTVCRVDVYQTEVDRLFGYIPIMQNRYGELIDLPNPEENTIFLVSSLVLSRIEHRNDVYAPDTGPTAVRNATGHIVSVIRLVKPEKY